MTVLTETYVGFTLDGRRFALSLASVEQVVRAVAVTPLPNAPAVITGVIDLHGRVVPVADVRRRFGLPARAIEADDHFLVARTPRRELALWVDAVFGIVPCAAGDVVHTQALVPGLEHVSGIAQTPDGLVLIHDLDRFLALDEELSLQGALQDD